MEDQKKNDKELIKKKVARTMDYKRAFGSEQGKRVLRDLISYHHLMGSTYSGNVNDMLFREGERAVILRILKILETDETQMQKLIEESANEI